MSIIGQDEFPKGRNLAELLVDSQDPNRQQYEQAFQALDGNFLNSGGFPLSRLDCIGGHLLIAERYFGSFGNGLKANYC